MASKPTFGAYDVTFDLSKQGSQSALQKSLSSIRGTLKTFDSFFEPLLKEVERTADSVTYRAYASNAKLKQLENKIKELQAKTGIVTGFDKDLGIPIREPVITKASLVENAPVDRSKVRIANKRDAAALRAKAAMLGSSIQPVPGGLDGEFFLNMPKKESAVFKRAITIKNRQNSEEIDFAEKLREEAREQARIEKEKAKQEKAKEKEKEKEGSGDFRGFLATGIKLSVITFVLHELLKYLKMIFSVIMETASKARADVLASGATGIPMYKLQRYREFGESKGLGPDTYNDAFTSVVQKFQNITKIDQGALESLALVMGSDIKDLIMSGMGGKNPDVLLEKIINAFTSRALSGKNSVGQTVGVSDAVTELTEYLRKIDPNWSSILSVKLSDALNPVLTDRQRKDAANGGLIWDKGVPMNIGNFTDIDKSWLSAVKSDLGETVSLLEQLKSIFGRFMAPLAEVMNNLTRSIAMWFGTDDVKEQILAQDKQEASDRLKENKDYLAQIDSDYSAKIKDMNKKYGLSLNEESVMAASSMEVVDREFYKFKPKDAKQREAFQRDMQEAIVLGATKAEFMVANEKLAKIADPSNKEGGNTTTSSAEAVISRASRKTLTNVSDAIYFDLEKNQRAISPFGWYRDEEHKRRVAGQAARDIKKYSMERYLTGEAYRAYSNLSDSEKAKVQNIRVRNEDNQLTITLVDKDGRRLGGAVTRVGIAEVGGMDFEPVGGVLRNVLPTNSAGQRGAMAPGTRTTASQ